MVKPVSGASGNNPPDGYNKVTMYDEGSKRTKTFFVPVGQKLTVNGNTYDLDKAKGNELVFKGTKDNTKHNLMGIALEYLDANGDGRIDSKDTDQDMAGKINKKLSNTPYFVKNNDVFSDAGIFKGEEALFSALTVKDNSSELILKRNKHKSGKLIHRSFYFIKYFIYGFN